MDYLQRSKDPVPAGPDAKPADTDFSYTSLRLIDSDIEPGESQETYRKQKTVSRKQLVNKLNHTHFKQNCVRILFENFEDNLSTQKDALPRPCFGKHLVCLWTEAVDARKFIKSYRFKELQVITEEEVISVAAQVRAISSRGICLKLPESSIQHSCRKATRYTCKPLDVQLIQNGAIFSGVLMDFSAFAFRVEIQPTPSVPIHWINTGNPISMVVKAGEETLYADECKIIKRDEGVRRKHMVLAPVKDSIQRFSPRAYRSRRTTLSPSPDIFFQHPLTGKRVGLKVIDLSGSGIAVEDDEENSMLIPGLVLPSMTLNFANSFFIECKAQVIYRRVFKTDGNKRIVKCGIVFLDVPADDHMRLLSILHQAENKHIYICNKVDTDDLWRFFFETGFLYPKKYAHLHPHLNQIKKTYETLYSENTNIARHFTWQQKGRILAHLSMLRFYEKTWLIHHLAARTGDSNHAGVEILNQIGDFAYASHRLISSHMDFLICFFRPDNRFPNYFFGGIADKIQKPKACSIDAFAYIHVNSDAALPLPESWSVGKPDVDDLQKFEGFYENLSGGLMLQSLDLVAENEMSDRFDLVVEYQRLGLTRERRVYALKKDTLLIAIIMVNISDPALNLSELTNCVSLFVLDRKRLTPDILHRSLSMLSSHYGRKKFPLLLYPLRYADDNGIAYSRIYNLWVLATRYSDEYFKHYFDLVNQKI